LTVRILLLALYMACIYIQDLLSFHSLSSSILKAFVCFSIRFRHTETKESSSMCYLIHQAFSIMYNGNLLHVELSSSFSLYIYERANKYFVSQNNISTQIKSLLFYSETYCKYLIRAAHRLCCVGYIAL